MIRKAEPGWSPSHAAARRETKRRSFFYTSMNLWPFVGVLLVLLIAFMCVPVVHPFFPVDLPGGFHTTGQPKALREDVMKIYLLRDGRVYFRDSYVLRGDLPGLVHSAEQAGAERKVYLAVDAWAKYGDAAAVVEEIGKAGIREICFLAYKRGQ
jgi:biopolymer transport protein ExbD